MRGEWLPGRTYPYRRLSTAARGRRPSRTRASAAVGNRRRWARHGLRFVPFETHEWSRSGRKPSAPVYVFQRTRAEPYGTMGRPPTSTRRRRWPRQANRAIAFYGANKSKPAPGCRAVRSTRESNPGRSRRWCRWVRVQLVGLRTMCSVGSPTGSKPVGAEQGRMAKATASGKREAENDGAARADSQDARSTRVPGVCAAG